MTIEQVCELLKNLNANDIMDFGENYEGQNVFAIKSPHGTCCLTINSFDDDIWTE